MEVFGAIILDRNHRLSYLADSHASSFQDFTLFTDNNETGEEETLICIRQSKSVKLLLIKISKGKIRKYSVKSPVDVTIIRSFHIVGLIPITLLFVTSDGNLIIAEVSTEVIQRSSFIHTPEDSRNRLSLLSRQQEFIESNESTYRSPGYDQKTLWNIRFQCIIKYDEIASSYVKCLTLNPRQKRNVTVDGHILFDNGYCRRIVIERVNNPKSTSSDSLSLHNGMELRCMEYKGDSISAEIEPFEGVQQQFYNIHTILSKRDDMTNLVHILTTKSYLLFGFTIYDLNSTESTNENEDDEDDDNGVWKDCDTDDEAEVAAAEDFRYHRCTSRFFSAQLTEDIPTNMYWKIPLENNTHISESHRDWDSRFIGFLDQNRLRHLMDQINKSPYYRWIQSNGSNISDCNEGSPWYIGIFDSQQQNVDLYSLSTGNTSTSSSNCITKDVKSLGRKCASMSLQTLFGEYYCRSKYMHVGYGYQYSCTHVSTNVKGSCLYFIVQVTSKKDGSLYEQRILVVSLEDGCIHGDVVLQSYSEHQHILNGNRQINEISHRQCEKIVKLCPDETRSNDILYVLTTHRLLLISYRGYCNAISDSSNAYSYEINSQVDVSFKKLLILLNLRFDSTPTDGYLVKSLSMLWRNIAHYAFDWGLFDVIMENSSNSNMIIDDVSSKDNLYRVFDINNNLPNSDGINKHIVKLLNVVSEVSDNIIDTNVIPREIVLALQNKLIDIAESFIDVVNESCMNEVSGDNSYNESLDEANTTSTHSSSSRSYNYRGNHATIQLIHPQNISSDKYPLQSFLTLLTLVIAQLISERQTSQISLDSTVGSSHLVDTITNYLDMFLVNKLALYLDLRIISRFILRLSNQRCHQQLIQIGIESNQLRFVMVEYIRIKGLETMETHSLSGYLSQLWKELSQQSSSRFTSDFSQSEQISSDTFITQLIRYIFDVRLEAVTGDILKRFLEDVRGIAFVEEYIVNMHKDSWIQKSLHAQVDIKSCESSIAKSFDDQMHFLDVIIIELWSSTESFEKSMPSELMTYLDWDRSDDNQLNRTKELEYRLRLMHLLIHALMNYLNLNECFSIANNFATENIDKLPKKFHNTRLFSLKQIIALSTVDTFDEYSVLSRPLPVMLSLDRGGYRSIFTQLSRDGLNYQDLTNEKESLTDMYWKEIHDLLTYLVMKVIFIDESIQKEIQRISHDYQLYHLVNLQDDHNTDSISISLKSIRELCLLLSNTLDTLLYSSCTMSILVIRCILLKYRKFYYDSIVVLLHIVDEILGTENRESNQFIEEALLTILKNYVSNALIRDEKLIFSCLVLKKVWTVWNKHNLNVTRFEDFILYESSNQQSIDISSTITTCFCLVFRLATSSEYKLHGMDKEVSISQYEREHCREVMLMNIATNSERWDDCESAFSGRFLFYLLRNRAVTLS